MGPQHFALFEFINQFANGSPSHHITHTQHNCPSKTHSNLMMNVFEWIRYRLLIIIKFSLICEGQSCRVRVFICLFIGWFIDWLIDWVSEWVIEWVSESVSQSVSQSVSEWVSEWISEWISEWVTEWMNEGEVTEWLREGGGGRKGAGIGDRWVVYLCLRMWSFFKRISIRFGCRWYTCIMIYWGFMKNILKCFILLKISTMHSMY